MSVGAKFTRSEGGAAAVEFGLVAPIFLLLLFAIFEYSFFAWKRSILRNIVFEVSRDVQTGAIQRSASPADAFKISYCENTPAFLNCEALRFDVRSYSDIGSASFTPMQLDSNNEPKNFSFDPGYQEEIVTVRATTHHAFTTPGMREVFQPDGKPVIVLGYAVFRNEPFGCLDEC